MRLGKSVQSILAAEELGVKNILVLAPAIVVPNWGDMFREWWNGPFPNLRVLSYNGALDRKLGKPDLVICDEAHYLKSVGAQRTKAAMKVARAAGHAWLLSGTPMPNHPGELWSPVKGLWQELIPAGITRYDQWLDLTCKTRPTIYGPKPYAVKEEAKPYLRDLKRRIMLRRTVKDVELQLPEVRVDVVKLPPQDLELEEYGAYAESEEAYVSTLRRLLGEAKAGPVALQVVEELRTHQYEKIVILYWHKSVRDRIAWYLATARIPYITAGGEDSQTAKYEAAQRFNRGEAQVFLAQQMSVGLGISLASASEMILVEPAWAPDDNHQAIARLQHVGKTETCRVRIPTVKGTLDEPIMGTIAQKMRMKEDVDLTGGV